MSERRSSRIAASTPPVDEQSQRGYRPDVSTLRQPIKLGNEGVSQIVRCLQSATPEVTDVLLYECNIVYECRVCKSLFRGLTNLLAHKRAYCLAHYSDPENPFTEDGPEDETVIVHPEDPPPDPPPSKEWDNYIDSDCESVTSQKSRRGLRAEKATKSVVEQLAEGSFQGKSKPYAFYTKVVEKCEKRQAARKSSLVSLCEIQGTKAAVLQNMGVTDMQRAATTKGFAVISKSSVSANRNEYDASVMESDSTSASKESFKENLNLSRARATMDSLYSGGEKGGKDGEAVAYIEPCSPTGYINMSLRKASTETRHEKQPKAMEKSGGGVSSGSGSSGNRSTTSSKGHPQSPKSHWAALEKFKQCDPIKKKCLKCMKIFSARSTLLRHMKETHMARRTSTKCPLCSKVMTRSYAIVRHLKEVHGKTDEELENMKDQVYKKCLVSRVNKKTNNLLVAEAEDQSPGQQLTAFAKTSPKTVQKSSGERKPETAGSATTKVKMPAKGQKLVFGKKHRKSTTETVALKLGGGFRCFRCGTIFGKQDILEKHQQKCTATKQLSGLLSPTRQTASGEVENVFEKFQKNLISKSQVVSPKKSPLTPAEKKVTRAQSATPEPGSHKQEVGKSPKKSDTKKKSANDKGSEADLKGLKMRENGDTSLDIVKADVVVKSKAAAVVSKLDALPTKPSPKHSQSASKKKAAIEKSAVVAEKQVSNLITQEKQISEIDKFKLIEKAVAKEKQAAKGKTKSIISTEDKTVLQTASGQNHSRTRSNTQPAKQPSEGEKSDNESTYGKNLAQARAERLRARRHLSQGEGETDDDSALATGAKRKRETDETSGATSPSNTTRPEGNDDLGGKEEEDGSYADSVTLDNLHAFKSKNEESCETNTSVSNTAIETTHLLGTRLNESLVQSATEEILNRIETSSESMEQRVSTTIDEENMDLKAPQVQIRLLGTASEARNKLKDKIIITVTEPRPRSLSPKQKKKGGGGMVSDYRRIGEGSKLVKGISQDDQKKILSMVDSDNLTCSKCGSKFRNVSNLHRHAVRHLGWRRYKCTICKATFFNRSECRRHIRLIHERKMATSLDTEDYIVDLEPDKMKTQSIGMPRVEIKLQRVPGQSPSKVTSSSSSSGSGSPKSEQGKGDAYNISTRRNPRHFDTSPFPRDDDDSDAGEEEDTDAATASVDLSSLRTRSGVYRKTTAAASTTLTSRAGESSSPRKKTRYPSVSIESELIDASEQFLLSKQILPTVSPGSGFPGTTKSAILSNVVAKPAFVIDSSPKKPHQTFPPYKAPSDKVKLTAYHHHRTPKKDVQSRSRRQLAMLTEDVVDTRSTGTAATSDTIVLRSPHQLGKQDWLSQMKDLPVASGLGDVEMKGRQMVTIMNADGTVLGKVPVSVQKNEDKVLSATSTATGDKEEDGDTLLMLLDETDANTSETAASGMEVADSTASTSGSGRTTNQALQLVPIGTRSREHKVRHSSAYLQRRSNMVTAYSDSHTGRLDMENDQTKEMDIDSSTRALLHKIQQDVPSEATLEDHEVAMATSMMGESGFSVGDSDAKCSLDKLVHGNQTKPSLMTEASGQLQYTVGDGLLQMISSDQIGGMSDMGQSSGQ